MPTIFTLLKLPAKKKKPENKVIAAIMTLEVLKKSPSIINSAAIKVIITAAVHNILENGKPISIPFCTKAFKCKVSPMAKNRKASARIILCASIIRDKVLLCSAMLIISKRLPLGRRKSVCRPCSE